MNVRLLSLILGFLVLLAGPVRAMFILPQTEKVPIERVLKNMEARFAKEPNNVEAAYHLARVHSMAYSTNLASVKISKYDQSPMFEFPGSDAGVPTQIYAATNAQIKAASQKHLTNAIAYYERAIVLIKTGTNAQAHPWLSSPIHLGYAWCLDQAKRRDDAIKAYRIALQVAWHSEVEGGVTLKEQLGYSWDKIRSKQNPFSKLRRGLGAGVCYSEEIIGYLLKILDPRKDAKEIAQLQADQLELRSMGRAITPIVIPLESNVSLEQLVDPTAAVAFDLDGSGLQRQWGWITPKGAWLAFDKNGSGKITSGLQLFGNVTFWIFWRNGYDALSSLDDNGDGILSGNELKGLALWNDKNMNGVSDPGEVKSLDAYGIRELRCDSAMHSSGINFNAQGMKLDDGSTRPTYDWVAPFHKGPQG